MSVVHGSRTCKRFQSTRRTSGGLSENEGSVAHAACVQPDRTFGRTYLQRGFSGYKRPRRPKRTMPFGVKQWSAEDELPGVTRPGLAEISRKHADGHAVCGRLEGAAPRRMPQDPAARRSAHDAVVTYGDQEPGAGSVRGACR